jgi:hypothetical protein
MSAAEYLPASDAANATAQRKYSAVYVPSGAVRRPAHKCRAAGPRTWAISTSGHWLTLLMHQHFLVLVA